MPAPRRDLVVAASGRHRLRHWLLAAGVVTAWLVRHVCSVRAGETWWRPVAQYRETCGSCRLSVVGAARLRRPQTQLHLLLCASAAAEGRHHVCGGARWGRWQAPACQFATRPFGARAGDCRRRRQPRSHIMDWPQMRPEGPPASGNGAIADNVARAAARVRHSRGWAVVGSRTAIQGHGSAGEGKHGRRVVETCHARAICSASAVVGKMPPN